MSAEAFECLKVVALFIIVFSAMSATIVTALYFIIHGLIDMIDDAVRESRKHFGDEDGHK